jgi:wyosine [tRNA(Phe)-imidazoG37] synthetase (radical SAM superfamily)
MQTVLFHSTIFGPIHSRRLGVSLGVNLSPDDGKTCTFDCLYCEAGYNAQGTGTTGLPPRDVVRVMLEERLRSMSEAGQTLDVITFSGNGEPTLHPDFEGIVDDTLSLRDRYFPAAKVSVLSNSTRLDRDEVCRALARVDNNILKLDSAVDTTMRALDRPVSASYSVAKAVEGLKRFAGRCIVQTMLTRGEHDGKRVDNTTQAELDALIGAYKAIGPREVMIYSIDRKTPEQSLEHVGREELEAFGRRVRAEVGCEVQVV